MMEGWKEYKFSEIADFPPKVKLVKGKEYPFVLMDEVDAGFKYVKASFSKDYNGSGAKFENGDTLFARITPSLENGKIAQIKGIDKPAFGSTEFFVFRGKKDISDNNFIYYLSKTDWFRQNAVNSMVGASGRQRADAKFVGKTKLLIPPLPTQRKIAKILSAYDDLIENNLKRIKLLEEMAQKTYEEWFVRFKFPGYETAKFDKETGLPEGWKRVRLGEICNVSGGGTPSKSVDEYWNNGTITWFSPTDLSKSNTFCLLDSSNKITELGLKKSSAKLLQPNSFMMTSRATIGLFGLIDKPFSTNQGFINVTPKKAEDKYFLFFNFKYRVPEFYNHASGATFPEISKSKFKFLKVNWPTDKIIIKFDDGIAPIISNMMNLQIQNQRLKEARDILLPRLMTGMISV